MTRIKSKQIGSAVFVCVLALLLTPALTQAGSEMLLAEAETGSIAARQAAEQKAALAKKAAEREAKKAAAAAAQAPVEAKESVETAVPVDEHKEK
ncbi:hypothetical protein NP590_14645 [Methylomonas sp. SURF-2]|uniref:Uncharacterized protein n=1 Tax=Methylomonas subterranea TaxID=2952225 RepID=A0ABT1TIP7_9GAMM|nr:hypothetical protein [Methylomonas sp. SURF-2]MCQ8105351.1 hypothetical protein [Methylomonas sp. SURF-2]